MKIPFTVILLISLFWSCSTTQTAVQLNKPNPHEFVWEGANLYFLLIDRFHNGNPANDHLIARDLPTGKLRGFEGGDLRGVIEKLDAGYFEALGVNVIWMSPVVEQIHGSVDEGTGNTYGFHGYWTKDWTNVDPAYGTMQELQELIDKAHQKGIRIMLDAVINHTGPVTELDPVFPSDWVRTSPKCTYDTYDHYIHCTLVENLPDVKTESNTAVELPPQLVEKWKKEGRYEQEIAELDAFFTQTGYPRAPKYYIMKWLSDYIRDLGIDGYRIDTAKHVTEDVWSEFAQVCQQAFDSYRSNHPNQTFETTDFYTVGEVYGYGIFSKRIYNFGDKKVDYFANGFDNLINFDFKGDAAQPYEKLFNAYNSLLQTDLQGKSVLNYISSHDDSWPFDKKREKPIEAGTKLLLTPGISQIYYGDESARSLDIEGTQGDATLRLPMNWTQIEKDEATQKVLRHYQKLGQFRKNHPAIGAGIHNQIPDPYYTFNRTWGNDQVVIALDVPVGEKEINVGTVFTEGAVLIDAYSGVETRVSNGKAQLDTPFEYVLLEKK